MQGGTSALDFLEDVGGGRGPDEGRGMLVVLGDVVVNGGDELVHAAKHAAAQALDGEIAKESLDHVQSRRRGRGEMNVEARVTIEPTLHSGMLVGGIVVHDEMKLFVLGSAAVN